MERKKVNFVCVNTGTKYPKHFTQTLYNMVTRNTTYDVNFFVVTENTDLYWENYWTPVEPIVDDLHSWWTKLQLYSKTLLPEGEYLYMDLDVVIVDNIDCFFDHKPFGILRDFIRPDDGLLPGKEYNSSVVKFDNTTTHGIYEYYIQNRKQWADYQKQIHFFGDQNVVSSYLNHYPTFCNHFPDEWAWSFKKGVERGKHAGDRSEWFGRFPPMGGKVCIFHGEPNPTEVANDFEWIGECYQ